MTQSLVLNLVIIAVLVTLLASIHRVRRSAQLRLWIAGWLFILVHFALLLLRPQQPWAANLVDAASSSVLLLCAVSFLLSVSPLATASRRLGWAAAVSLAPMALVWTSFFSIGKAALYLGLDLLGQAAVLWLIWFFYRRRLRLAVAATLLIAISLGWIAQQAVTSSIADYGFFPVLAELFALYALLLAVDQPRRSAGVVTTVIGLVCWAAVFPSAVLLAAYLPGLHADPELWNVPKYFVAFGMIVILLEDEIALASRQKAQYQMLFEHNPLPMWIYEPQTRAMLEVNAAAVAEYGYRREEFLALPLETLLQATGGEQAAANGRSGGAPLPAWSHVPAGSGEHSGRRIEGPWRLRKRSGAELLVETAAHEVQFEGRQARLVLAQDVTEELKLRDQLLHQANHDPLTGLPNRLLLAERLNAALASASRRGAKAAVLCIDLDRFKQINDTFGHAAGDACLKEVAARLRQRLRTVDTAARIGGEEFLVILNEINSAEDAEGVARDLLRALAVPLAFHSQAPMELGASIGIAIYPDDAADPVELWRMSDVAMYRAKRTGGNQYCVFASMAGEPR